MPDQIVINDFSAGWIPSDDSINGRKNGLRQMDNLELNKNGALTLAGGCSVKYSGFPSSAHTIFSRTLNGVRCDYSAFANGALYRNTTSIVASGGSAIKAGFGSAFNYVLACSGVNRYKDNGTTATNLGVGAPTAAPTLVDSSLDTMGCYSIIGSILADYVMYTGTATIVTETAYPSGGGHARPASIQYLQLTADGNGKAVFQTYNSAGDPRNLTKFTPPTGSVYGTATDNDFIPFFGYIVDPFGVSLQIDILLTAGNAYGDQMSNYYTYKIDDLAQLEFDAFTGVFHTYIRRSDFTRVGTNQTLDWQTTYGFRITFSGTNGQVINILGTSIIPPVGGAVSMFGGDVALNGVYQFAQVNVNNTGSYVALSPLSPASSAVSLVQSQVQLGIETPSDGQVNEVWIFARSTGGTNYLGDASLLDGRWYRVAKYTSTLSGSKYVQQGDLTTLTLDLKFNTNLVSIASSSISDTIYDIVGPIEGRWFYFTSNMMYPSDINNPDLVDTTKAIRTTGSNNEIFLWAFIVGEKSVLVGTSCDVYLLSGTFITLPDNTVDIYYGALNCKYPPLTYDATLFSGEVFYLASDGWRTITANGAIRYLCSPSTDILYRGESVYGYTGPNLKIVPGSVRFPVVIGKDKLWCFITGTTRAEVWDFTRQYWYTVSYGIGDVTAATYTQDGQVLCFYGNDRKLREIGLSNSKLVDGATKQFIGLTTAVFDNGTPLQRKDSSTFKIRTYTGSSGTLNVSLLNEDGVATVVSSALQSSSIVDEIYIDLHQFSNINLVKTYLLKISGQVADFLLDDVNILFETRPVQSTFTKIYNTNFNSGNKKRLRVWPLVIDTMGGIVNFTPIVDNFPLPAVPLQSTNKDTKLIFYTTDVQGIDYGGTLTGGLHEFFGMLNPDIVQTFPIARRFDQLGPQEIFRFGKIEKLELRVLPIGGSFIPIKLYFSDTTNYTTNLQVTNGKEGSYFINVPKGTSGNILRIELGPTPFDFHRFYMRALIVSTGSDTDNKWITLGVENG